MNILQLICSDNFIAVNKSLIQSIGIEPALLLGELASEAVYWASQDKTEDGYFFSTVENVEERTTLSAYQQRKALMLLQEKGIIDVISKKGTPPKRYIKINENSILELFNFQNLNNSPFKSEIFSLSKVKKVDTNNKQPKKKREKEKEYIKAIVEKFNYYSDEFRVAINDFIDMRNNMRKPVTERALTMIVKKATELSNGDESTVINILNQSTSNSWLGVYPLKENRIYRTSKNEFVDMLNEMEVNDFDEERSNTDFGFTSFGIPEHTN